MSKLGYRQAGLFLVAVAALMALFLLFGPVGWPEVFTLAAAGVVGYLLGILGDYIESWAIFKEGVDGDD